MLNVTRRRRINSTSSNTSVDSIKSSNSSSNFSNYDINGIKYINNDGNGSDYYSDYDASHTSYKSGSSNASNVSIDDSGGSDINIMENIDAKKKKMQHKELKFQENVKLCIEYFWRGFCDAFAWPSSLFIIYGSNTLRNRTLKCFTLNGVIFLGSIFFFKNFTLPIIHFFLGNPVLNSKGGENYSLFISSFLDSIVNLIYQLFWVYPIFLLSFILNSIWYQDIANRIYKLQYGETINSKFNYDKLLKAMADEIYRAILFMNYLIFSTIIYIIPIFGPLLSFMYFCWIYSFYSFEYKWINKGWSLEQRINYFEEKWAYFAGFGFTFTFITFYVDVFFSTGIFALLFPIYIIMAHNASPMPRNNKKFRLIPHKLPIFWVAKKMNDKLITTFHNRTIK